MHSHPGRATQNWPSLVSKENRSSRLENRSSRLSDRAGLRGSAQPTTSQSKEVTFLVGIDLRQRRRKEPQKAKDAAAVLDSPSQPGKPDSPHVEDSIEAAGSSQSASEAKAGKKEPSFSAQDSMAELRELSLSAGAEVAGEFLQVRDKADPATLIGRGKLEELSATAQSAGAGLIIFDHELTPSQQRNIEDAVQVRVIDRTQLILDIFARHARTREGQLQVELAQLEYLLPRLTGRGLQMSQLGGGIGTRGPGETQLETDRRKIH